MDPFVVHAYAKINLGLKVLGKREDGYHNILSVFQTLDLSDQLTLSRFQSGEVEILCEHPNVPTDSSNLIFRAIEALWNETGCREGMKIHLQKNIPVGAGLGGGSSDAAAVLRILNKVWKLELSTSRLREIASELGSDVPFFLRRGTAIVTGRGERIRYLQWTPNVFFAVVYPGVHISTRWAFENLTLNLTKTRVYNKFVNSVDDFGLTSPDSLLDILENDFSALIESTYPIVGKALKSLTKLGASSCSLSGSGSAVFGVFRDREEAFNAVSHMKDCGFEAYLCRPISDRV